VLLRMHDVVLPLAVVDQLQQLAVLRRVLLHPHPNRIAARQQGKYLTTIRPPQLLVPAQGDC
jgi:hypothetical protein